ncbi:MAG: hypothetical protein QXI19_13195 [Candidatus Caldarchaeum sp.]
MKFREWKAKTMTALISLAREASDEKIKNDIDALMRKLSYLKSRDLSMFLSDLYHAAVDEPKLLNLAPTSEQVEAWFSRDED